MELAHHKLPPQDKLRHVHRTLLKKYGRVHLKKRPFIQVMIRTILSQNTNDNLRDRAFNALQSKFPGPESLESAPLRDIESAIKICGLPRQKARAIKNFLAWFKARYRTYHTSKICREEPSELLRELMRVKGVGAKTARVALLFSCGHKFFPVDTHIFRVMKRLGIIGKNVTREKVHEILEGMTGNLDVTSLHINVIKFGRDTCTARNPRCSDCSFYSLCLSRGLW